MQPDGSVDIQQGGSVGGVGGSRNLAIHPDGSVDSSTNLNGGPIGNSNSNLNIN